MMKRIAALLFLATPALAQAPAPASAPTSEAPERTVAAFGDWVVRCERLPTGRSCEMAQTVADQRQQPVAVLAIGRASTTAPWRMIAQVPVNIAVAEPARLTLEPVLVMPFRSCTPRGCFAELDLGDALARMRARPADSAARLDWKDPAGAEQTVPVSFRGFGAAFEALGRER